MESTARPPLRHHHRYYCDYYFSTTGYFGFIITHFLISTDPTASLTLLFLLHRPLQTQQSPNPDIIRFLAKPQTPHRFLASQHRSHDQGSLARSNQN
jgi:hypothetical protein